MEEDSTLEELAEMAIDTCISHLPGNSATINDLEQAQNTDPVCSMVIKYSRDGWPRKHKLNEVTLLGRMQSPKPQRKPITLWE